MDSTSAEAPVPHYTAHLKEHACSGMKIGVPVEYMKHATGETAAPIDEAIDALRAMGCEIREISLPSTDYAIACYYIIATAEASSNLARYDGVRYTSRSADSSTLSNMYRNSRGEGFGAEVKRRIMLGTYVLSHGYYDAYYLKAQKVRAPDRPRFHQCISNRGCHRRARSRLTRRSKSAKRSTTPWRCTCPTSTPSPAVSPASPA